jgi:hypothetical protein
MPPIAVPNWAVQWEKIKTTLIVAQFVGALYFCFLDARVVTQALHVRSWKEFCSTAARHR